MTANPDAPGKGASTRRVARRLRIVAFVVLAAGIAGAEMIYFRGSHDLPDDPALIGYDKAASRQAGVLYGQQGVVVQNWANDLQRPGTQAGIIVAAAALAAGGCFYFARLLDRNAQ